MDVNIYFLFIAHPYAYIFLFEPCSQTESENIQGSQLLFQPSNHPGKLLLFDYRFAAAVMCRVPWRPFEPLPGGLGSSEAEKTGGLHG